MVVLIVFMTIIQLLGNLVYHNKKVRLTADFSIYTSFG